MAQHVTPADLERLTALMTAQLPAYLADLQRLVDIDCGSYTKAGVDEVGRWVAGTFRDLGGDVQVLPNQAHGDTVVGTFGDAGAEGPALLLVGHTDTVFDPGTVAERPFAIKDGIATGPGVSDMKGGLLAGLYALRILRAFGGGGPDGLPFGRIVFVANPDEEIGSPVSTPTISAHAVTVDVALVMEGARANGDIVSSRKGIVDFELRVTGRAAHAGVEPEKGRSAVLEAAHKIVSLHALNGRWPGVTVNAGVVRGGTRPNVVAAETIIQVDLRSVQRTTLEEAEAAIRAIAATNTVPDTTCEVVLMGRFWPMEKLERSGRLVDHAVSIAGDLGFPLRDAATGGASDANTIAGLGIPAIDGLGPIGGSDHSPAEYLEVDSIVPRTVLLAGLILALGRDPVVAEWSAERRARG
jgi:glutamate carboxypeptidase